MRTGGLTSSAPGEISDIILQTDVRAIAGRTVNAKMYPYAPFAKRYFMPFVCGVWTGEMTQQVGNAPIEINAVVRGSLGTVYFEDAGGWPTLPAGATIPDGGALAFEAERANR